MDRILVTGATGHLGNTVIETLLTDMQPDAISVITRQEAKQKAFQERGFQAHLGNYADIPSLEAAMQGIDTVLLISSGDQGDRMQEHKNVVDAAKKAGVQQIAYTSRCLRDRKQLVNTLMAEHFETEAYIIASGMQYIFFRNILYMDVIPQFIGGTGALEQGIFLPAGAGRVSFALRSDMGEAMAKVLLKESFHNTIYNFTGERSYSFDDVAAVLTQLSGKKVSYTDVEPQVFSERMQQKQLPVPVIQKIIAFLTDIKNNQEDTVTADLAVCLGRKPAGLEDGLKILFGL